MVAKKNTMAIHVFIVCFALYNIYHKNEHVEPMKVWTGSKCKISGPCRGSMCSVEVKNSWPNLEVVSSLFKGSLTFKKGHEVTSYRI